MKGKQGASGYPDWANTPDTKAQYVADYERHEGIKLDPDKIQHNPGMRTLCKFMLNRFWGKFGERLRKPQTMAITEAGDLYRAVSDPLWNINAIRICTNDLLEIVRTSIESKVENPGQTNIFIAAFTTCIARLKFYELLERLNERALYCNTLLCTRDPQRPTLRRGDYLGGLTRELKANDHIVEFISGGRKLWVQDQKWRGVL